MAYNFSLYHFTPDHKIHQSHIASFVLIFATYLIREDFLAFGLFYGFFYKYHHTQILRFSQFCLSSTSSFYVFSSTLPAATLFGQEQQVSERAAFSSREHFFQRCMGIPSPNTSFSNLAHHRNIFTTFCRMFSLSERINILELKNLVLYLDFLKMQLACKILLLCQCYLISKLFRNRNPKFQ